jgi:hypothetical protein
MYKQGKKRAVIKGDSQEAKWKFQARQQMKLYIYIELAMGRWGSKRPAWLTSSCRQEALVPFACVWNQSPECQKHNPGAEPAKLYMWSCMHDLPNLRHYPDCSVGPFMSSLVTCLCFNFTHPCHFFASGATLLMLCAKAELVKPITEGSGTDVHKWTKIN